MGEPKFGGPFTEEGRKDFWEGWNHPIDEFLGLPHGSTTFVIVGGVLVLVGVYVIVPLYTILKKK
jgi:hypothetical protein